MATYPEVNQQPGSPEQLAVPEPPGAPPADSAEKLVPAETSDLLFLNGQKLMRWDHVTGFMGALADNVIDYSASADGRRIAMLRPNHVSANGVELFDLILLDMQTKVLHTILAETSRLEFLRISPDGQWLAYWDPGKSSAVLAINIDEPATVVNLGDCQKCTALTWSADHKAIFWLDERGAWLSAPEKPAARLVHPLEIEIADPKGAKLKAEIQFSAPRWSPTGRFVLVEVQYKNSGIHWQGLLDTRMHRLVEIPDTFENGKTSLSLSWLQDGRLALGRGSNSLEYSRPFIQLWLVVPTSTDLLVHSKTFFFEAPQFSLEQTGAANSADSRLSWLAPLNENTLVLGLCPLDPAARTLLFAIDVDKGLPLLFAEAPAGALLASWSPDGRGVLIREQSSKIIFISPGSEPVEISLSPGTSASNFTWLPPAPRN